MTRWKKTITSIGALLLVVALLTSCTGPTPSVAPPPALSEKKEVTSEDLLLVDQLLLAGKYEDAVLQLQKLGQIDPKNNAVQDKLRTATAEWKFTEAQTLVAVGAYAEAIKKMKTALDVLPNDKRILMAMDEAYLNLGKKYLELLDVARAKEALLAVNYDQNLRLQAQGLMNLDVQAVENTQKGYQALQGGDYTLAMSYFKAALQLKPDLAQAQSGMKATEMMVATRPTSLPQTFVQPTYQQPYIPPSGTEPPATTQPAESNSWEKPASSSAGTSDWGQFKQWMENEINGNQMSGNAINENPLLDFENLAKIEDPQAYNYLAESDFANSLYLTAIKIYGERALYIASEIPRIFPLPNSLDPNYQTARQRIQRLLKDASFVDEGVGGLRAPTIFKATQKNLQALIDNELASLTSSAIAGFFAPPEVGQLSDQSQAYVDEFDLAQSKVLMVPFSQLPAWAQVKRYYIEASLNAYMLSEVASDFEGLLPLPGVLAGVLFSPATTLDDVSVHLKAESAYPKPGDSLAITLEAINKSATATAFASIHVSLPAGVQLLDSAGGSHRVENGVESIVWEAAIPPAINLNQVSTATSAIFLFRPSFLVKVLPDTMGANLNFNLWLTRPANSIPSILAFTPYASSGGFAIKLRVDKSIAIPGDTLKYTCELVNTLTPSMPYYLTIAVPPNTTVTDLGSPPIGTLGSYGSGQGISWSGTILQGEQLTRSFSVQVNNNASIGTINSNAAVSFLAGNALVTNNLSVSVVAEAQDEILSQKVSLSVPVGTGAAPGYRSVLDETIRLVRYSENLHWNLSTTRTPSALDIISTGNLVRAANELSSALYWIPIKWAQLSQLPYEYFVGYPTYSSGLVDLLNAASLFDRVTGVVVKNPDSYLTISADLTTQFGTPDSWKDMIEFLRAQLLQRLAELGYR